MTVVLHAALYLAALVIGARILTAVTLRPSGRPGGDDGRG
jgi:hypothetical protein